MLYLPLLNFKNYKNIYFFRQNLGLGLKMLNATFNNISVILQGFQYFSRLTSTSLITGGTFLKSGGTKYHFRQVKVPGTAPY